MIDVFQIGSRIKARFEPKNRETLRPCMVELIGREFNWEWVGTSDVDEPFPGQSRWMIERQHDAEIPDECKGRWCPREDLELVEIVRG